MLRHPTDGATAFEVLVYNSDVRALVKENRSHALFDDGWASARRRDVIAADEGEARRRAAERYPPEEGFVIEALRPARF